MLHKTIVIKWICGDIILLLNHPVLCLLFINKTFTTMFELYHFDLLTAPENVGELLFWGPEQKLVLTGFEFINNKVKLANCPLSF